MTGAGPDGVVVVDKPAGWTSHDVVARIRRLAGTRKVGHAGTLDPMATGVLVVGLGRATRLLGHLAAADKEYRATVRLGESTVTDDATGETVSRVSAAGLHEARVRAEAARFTGVLQQVPSAVSAVKVAGRRAYDLVRAGQDVDLPPRQVHVDRFEVLALCRPTPDLVDLDVEVTCSSGTYVRALARDLGAALGVGGHLTALRRTGVGPFDLAQARTLDGLDRAAAAGEPLGLPLVDAVRRLFGVREVDAATAVRVGHGAAVPAPDDVAPDVLVGVVGPDGGLLSLARRDGAVLRPAVVLGA